MPWDPNTWNAAQRPPWMSQVSDGTLTVEDALGQQTGALNGQGGPSAPVIDPSKLPPGLAARFGAATALPASSPDATVPLGLAQAPLATAVSNPDPFRLNDPGAGPAATTRQGDLIRYTPGDPRERNPFMYRDTGNDGKTVWRSSVQQADMGANGFTPGFMTTGIGGGQSYVSSPLDYLMGAQQAAQANGLDPRFTLDNFTGQLNRGADATLRANLAAQTANTQLGLGNLSARTTTSEGTADRASRERIAGQQNLAASENAQRQLVGQLFAAGMQAPGGLTPQLLAGIAPMITAGGGSSAPAGIPAAGGSAPTAPPGRQPDGGGMQQPFPRVTPPGAPPVGGQPAGVPGGPAGAMAAMQAGAANNEMIRNLQGAFGTMKDGKFVPADQVTPEMAAGLLDRLQAGNTSDQQRAALVQAIRGGQFGDPTAVQNALLQATAAAQFQGAPPVDPKTGRPVNFLSGPSGASDPMTAPPFAVNGANGQPLYRFQVGPVSAWSRWLGNEFSGGVPYNQIVGPNGQVVPISPTMLGSAFPGRQSTTPQTHLQRAGQGNAILELLRSGR